MSRNEGKVRTRTVGIGMIVRRYTCPSCRREVTATRFADGLYPTPGEPCDACDAEVEFQLANKRRDLAVTLEHQAAQDSDPMRAEALRREAARYREMAEEAMR